MRTHTNASDSGETQLPGNRRVRKGDPHMDAVGHLDELNAYLGLCLQRARVEVVEEVAAAVAAVQADLLAAGAVVAAAGSDASPAVALDNESIERIEQWINGTEAQLPKLAAFILPTGTELACRLHVARTFCRRTERTVVAAADAGVPVPPVVTAYLNRLGDLLFVLARVANYSAGGEDETWRP